MRLFLSLASVIEEMSRKEGTCHSFMNIVLYQSLADKLWTPLKIFAYNPAMAALGCKLYVIITLRFSI
jgi:hypothetical protein